MGTRKITKKPARAASAGPTEPTESAAPTEPTAPQLPGMPQPVPDNSIKVRGLQFPLFSRVTKALGKLPHDDVSDLLHEMSVTPTLSVAVK